MREVVDQMSLTAATVLEVVGVVIIVGGVLYGLGRACVHLARGRRAGVYTSSRTRIGHALLLGLEVLVASDIIRTVAVDLTLSNIGVLAIVVLVRGFLSFTIEVETTGRWPWQQAPSKAEET